MCGVACITQGASGLCVNSVCHKAVTVASKMPSARLETLRTVRSKCHLENRAHDVTRRFYGPFMSESNLSGSLFAGVSSSTCEPHRRRGRAGPDTNDSTNTRGCALIFALGTVRGISNTMLCSTRPPCRRSFLAIWSVRGGSQPVSMQTNYGGGYKLQE